jgi:hypothetical protein
VADIIEFSNKSKLDLACQTGRHSFVDRGLDAYSTPVIAVAALLTVEALPYYIWEPAAGHGNIVRFLRGRGHSVIASDICHYGGCALDFEADFLTQVRAPARTEMVITNPPYRYAAKFVDHALMLCPRVIMLARLAFLESECRARILDTGTLAAVHVFKRRLPFMHRENWTGPRASSAIPYAWFSWDRNHVGPATVDRIDWDDPS